MRIAPGIEGREPVGRRVVAGGLHKHGTIKTVSGIFVSPQSDGAFCIERIDHRRLVVEVNS